MIRVLLVDDHELVREAFCLILEKEPDITVAGQTGDGESTLTLCRKLQPDVVLMDISLADSSGIDITRKLVAECPAVRVLALSSYSDRSSVTRMLEAGAIGYINKAAGRDELLHGIRAAASGIPYLCRNIAAMLERNTGSRDKNGANAMLGKRETEVLMLIAGGKTSVQIAAQLGIATGTVEVHRRNIMNKLNLRSISELTKYAIREGLISP